MRLDFSFIDPDSPRWSEALGATRHDFYHLPMPAWRGTWRGAVAAQLARKLRPGGVLYIEMVDLKRLAATAREQGCEDRAEGYRFLWRRVLFLPIYICAGLALRSYVPASVVWDITGFAKSLTTIRRMDAAVPDRSERVYEKPVWP